jgi:hypothetical protein
MSLWRFIVVPRWAVTTIVEIRRGVIVKFAGSIVFDSGLGVKGWFRYQFYAYGLQAFRNMDILADQSLYKSFLVVSSSK